MIGRLLVLWSTAVMMLLAVAPSAQAKPLPFDRTDGPVTYLVGGEVHVGDGTVLSGGMVELRGTRLVRVGAAGAQPPTSGDAVVVDVAGKWVTPGLIAADTTLGLTEIDLEASTRDDARVDEHPVHAAYDAASAVNAASSLLPVQVIDGITSAAVTPRGGLLSGRVAWIDLIPGDHAGIVVASGIAMGAQAGQVWSASRAATLAKLREVFDDAEFYRTRRGAFDRRQLRDLSAHRLDLEALGPVLAGDIPLVVSAHRVSDMLALVQLANSYGIALVLTGATQAWMIADELAAAKVTVIVQPSDNLPYGFDQIGARMDNAALLHAAGVALGIAVLGDAHNLRNVTQQAGLAVAYGLDREAALRAVTLNIARAYGMQDDYGTLAAGKVANVVVWNGDPFELSSFPTAVYVRGNKMPAVSRQTELRDRYLKR
jgi:imidazolonepropionase-like amidohydrolase